MKRLDIIGAMAATLALIGGLAMALGYKTPAQVQNTLMDHETRIAVLEDAKKEARETHDWVKKLFENMDK